MGRTHVIGTLAVVHVSVLTYALYVDHTFIPAMFKKLKIYDFKMNIPFSLYEYGLLLLFSFFIVLLLLQVGKLKMIPFYILSSSLSLGSLYYFFPSHHVFTCALLFLLFTIGLLLPDIDSETSTFGKWLPFISNLIEHRTFTHTIWIMFLFVCILYFTSSIYVLALALGYFIHVVEDSFSKQGICWFYPLWGEYRHYSNGAVIKKGRLVGFSYKTNGLFEKSFFYSSILIHFVCIGFVLSWFLYR